MNQTLRREMAVECRMDDEAKGIVTYRASDETLDSYHEVVLASGWRFDNFKKNAPFVNSHNYDGIENLLGSVVGFGVEGKALSNTVQWAVDVPENTMAQLGWKMTKAGHLKAVSVGFLPTNILSRFDRDPKPFTEQCKTIGIDPERCNAIYLEQQQVELSACIIGANPNALAAYVRAYKDGVVTDKDIEFIGEHIAKQFLPDQVTQTAGSSVSSVADESARRRMRDLFVWRFEKLVNKI